MKQCKAYT